jgi:hypothetical protein
MNFDLIKKLWNLFSNSWNKMKVKHYSNDLQGFTEWISASSKSDAEPKDPDWTGKASGRSSDSIINTLLIRMGRYAKTYSRAVVIQFFQARMILFI